MKPRFTEGGLIIGTLLLVAFAAWALGFIEFAIKPGYLDALAQTARQRELGRITQAIRAHDATFTHRMLVLTDEFMGRMSVVQSTTGDCSNIVSGSGNVSVNCGGDSEKRSKP